MQIVEKIYSLPVPLNYATAVIVNLFMIASSYIITDEYLMKYLDSAIRRTRLRSELVAIFFFNIGNGFPELMTGILFGKRDEIICSLYSTIGGSLFINTVVLGFTILFKSKSVDINSNAFYKNIMFLFVSYTIMLYIFLRETVNILLPVLMILLYAVFLVYSVMNSRNYSDEIETVTENLPNNKFGAMINMCLYPMRKLFNLSMLSKKSAKPNLIAFFSSFAINFIIFGFHHDILSQKIFLCSIPFILLFSIAAYYLDSIKENDILSNFYNLLVSIYWIFITADFIVSQIDLLSAKYKISKEISSLIFVAFGNSFADIITNSIAAKRGLVRTATSSSLTSPIHNTLFNLGMSLFLFTLTKGRITFSTSYNTMFVLFPIVFSPISLFIISFNYEIRNRKLEYELAYVLFIIYGLFILFLVLESLFGGYRWS